MNFVITLILILVSPFVFAGTNTLSAKESVYQELVERETISTCSITSWNYRVRDWFAGTITYRKTILVKKWLEDSHGEMVPGSLENLITRQAVSRATEGVHGTQSSALAECTQNKNLAELMSFSKSEVTEAINRFLGK